MQVIGNLLRNKEKQSKKREKKAKTVSMTHHDGSNARISICIKIIDKEHVVYIFKWITKVLNKAKLNRSWKVNIHEKKLLEDITSLRLITKIRKVCNFDILRMNMFV